MTLSELKELLDTQYQFEEAMPVQQVKEKIGTTYSGQVFKMSAYQVCLVVSIVKSEGLCCDIYLRDQSGRMFCYDAPDFTVNLNENMEEELFRILNTYVESNKLSYTNTNGTILVSNKVVHKKQ